MYTVTFYSFKGGVGRSMALVNVGVQLAKAGKKVLLVDFDLEAPGLKTFSLGKPKKSVPGIVEYVSEYVETGISPQISDFCYESEQFDGGGKILIMPSGIDDGSYAKKLNSIDWIDLYENRDGYLLFEDLRSQWASALEVDYVLIDSRTGHSDVEGICTRQLPDAVCFLFFPNEQNLEGLKRVSALVDRDNLSNREDRRAIVMHFAVSNVPDIDDEDSILHDTLEKFQSELKYRSLATEIHHYESLSLLNQDIFSLTRPRSRLTKEYTRLVEAIVGENLQDRDAALNRLKQMTKDVSEAGDRSSVNDFTKTIERILLNFPKDPDIRLQSALAYEAIGETQDALNLLTPETAEGSDAPALAYAARARLLSRRGESRQAIDSLKHMLRSQGADMPTLLDAASLIDALSPTLFEYFGAAPSIKALPRALRFFVATQCDGSLSQLRAQIDIIDSLLSEEIDDGFPPRNLLLRQAALTNIGLGEFYRAIGKFDTLRSLGANFSIADCFNFAMAHFGANGLEAAKDLLIEVLKIDANKPGSERSPNYLQCIATAHIFTGNSEMGKQFLERAREEMSVRPRREFSAWSYSKVDSNSFLEHLKSLEALANGESIKPEFLSRDKNLIGPLLH